MLFEFHKFNFTQPYTASTSVTVFSLVIFLLCYNIQFAYLCHCWGHYPRISTTTIQTNLNLTTYGGFHTSYNLLASLKKKVKIFFFTYCFVKTSPTLPRHIDHYLNNFNLHYPIMFSHYLQLFWLINFYKKC